jgi:PIN domain nuclease of toxin-antitoxin system
MKIIIDTHIFLWALADPSRISKAKRLELESMANIIYVSSITIAELITKSSIGKIHINFNPVELAEQSGFEMLEFTGEDDLLLQYLPFHHKHHFDRMLIAQSLTNSIPIMTDDSKIALYECKVI